MVAQPWHCPQGGSLTLQGRARSQGPSRGVFCLQGSSKGGTQKEILRPCRSLAAFNDKPTEPPEGSCKRRRYPGCSDTGTDGQTEAEAAPCLLPELC